jgi:hypothetical protein
MATPTIIEVMRAIESALNDITGLRTTEFIKDQMSPPFAMVGVPEIPDYHGAFRSGSMTISPRVYVFVSSVVDRIGQTALAGYANPTGDQSIKTALEADNALGGVVAQVVVKSFRPLGAEEMGAFNYYGGVFDLMIVATGN